MKSELMCIIQIDIDIKNAKVFLAVSYLLKLHMILYPTIYNEDTLKSVLAIKVRNLHCLLFKEDSKTHKQHVNYNHTHSHHTYIYKSTNMLDFFQI